MCSEFKLKNDPFISLFIDVNIGGFNGAECVTHEDCAPFNGYCNFEKKRCAVSFNTMEINFLSCFINEMSSFTEVCEVTCKKKHLRFSFHL